MQFFNSFIQFVSGRNQNPVDRNLREWANTEYKEDAEWALQKYRETGRFPKGNRRQTERN